MAEDCFVPDSLAQKKRLGLPIWPHTMDLAGLFPHVMVIDQIFGWIGIDRNDQIK